MSGLFDNIQDRRARKQQERGLVECALRDKNEVHTLLTSRWIHGEAELISGRITLIKRFRFGLRVLPTRVSIDIHVQRVSPALGSTLGWSFGGTIYEIETPDGIIEWGLGAPSDHTWAINHIAPHHNKGPDGVAL